MSDTEPDTPADTFHGALSALNAALAQTPPEEQALGRALYKMCDLWPADPTVEDVRDTFAVCARVPALRPSARLSYTLMEMIKRLITDREGRYREHVRHSFDHHRAFGSEVPYGRFDNPVPVAHLPISAAEARALIQPMLAQWEAEIDADPIAHLSIAWEVLEFPQAPFDQVFEAWLQEVEAKGLGYGDSFSGLNRAMALCALASRGQQRVTRSAVDTIFLPLFDDPNPVLAAAAARFIGNIHADPHVRYNRGQPMPFADVLDYIAARPAATRRAVAGGFLNGWADVDEPFAMLRADPSLSDFDVTGWVLRILEGTDTEKVNPAAQAFWFYVHEGFAVDAPFMMALVDAGHVWEALMCATEIHERVEGVGAVLERLAQCDDADIAMVATQHLKRHYSDA